jgi:tRNA (guanine37-N1)-methyltransferase
VNIKIVTIFPQSFPGALDVGLIGRAKGKLWDLQTIDLKNYAYKLDDRPFGGGNGMVLAASVLEKAIQENNLKNIVLLSPRGRVFNHSMSVELSRLNEISLICGRYEGVDQRLVEYYGIQEISIGDFILCGGESAATVLIESIVRNIPGVLGNNNSALQESFSDFVLEHHQYTQPRVWKELCVPEVLLSGNHKLIESYRHLESLEITLKRRPDLFNKYCIYRLTYFFLSLMLE